MAQNPQLVPGLLHLLKPNTRASTGAQEEAALALGNLAAGSMDNQRAIAAEPGALANLVRLLKGPEGNATLFAQEWAAYTLANLSAGNVDNKVGDRSSICWWASGILPLAILMLSVGLLELSEPGQ
jgi:hypothetical protein